MHQKPESVTFHLVSFVVSTNHKLKIKESEKISKHLDFARELKKKAVEHEGDGDTNCAWHTWNNLQKLERKAGELEIREKIDTIQFIVLLRSARIIIRVLETWRNLLSIKLQGKTVQNKIQLDGEGDPQEIVQAYEIWLYYQMVYTQTRISPGKWDTKFSGIMRYQQILKSRPEDQT